MILAYVLTACTVIGASWLACLFLWVAIYFAGWISYKRTERRLIKAARQALTPSERR